MSLTCDAKTATTPWSSIAAIQGSQRTPSEKPPTKKLDDMSIKIPRWLVPMLTAFAVCLATWLGHLTLTLSEVLQVQARAEHLAESHKELRLDVREQAHALADVRETLARIEALLDRPSR